MNKVLSNLKAFASGDEGATMVEYGLMLALIAVVCIATVAIVGTNTQAVFNLIASTI